MEFHVGLRSSVYLGVAQKCSVSAVSRSEGPGDAVGTSIIGRV